MASVPIAALTRTECERFAGQIDKKPLTEKTKIGIVMTLTMLMSAAVDDPDCPVVVNPAAKLRNLVINPDTPRTKKLPADKFFERDEAAHLVSVIRDHFPAWYPFILCGFSTGLRTCELFALQWEDLDFRRGVIHVSRGWVQGAETSLKNHEARTVDMSSQLRAELRLWRRRSSIEWLKRGRPRPALLFPSHAETPLDDADTRRKFRAIVAKAELRHRTPYAMRHTFASLHLQNGALLAWVSKQMGHKSPEVTFTVYGHFVPGENRGAADALGEVLSGNQTQTRHKRTA